MLLNILTADLLRINVLPKLINAATGAEGMNLLSRSLQRLGFLTAPCVVSHNHRGRMKAEYANDSNWTTNRACLCSF